jgi:transposase
MPAPRKYPDELRKRSLRLVTEAMPEDPNLSLTAAVARIGPRVGVVPDTLRGWAKQMRVHTRLQPGTTTTDAATIKTSAEVRELMRANDILLAAL